MELVTINLFTHMHQLGIEFYDCEDVLESSVYRGTQNDTINFSTDESIIKLDGNDILDGKSFLTFADSLSDLEGTEVTAVITKGNSSYVALLYVARVDYVERVYDMQASFVVLSTVKN